MMLEPAMNRLLKQVPSRYMLVNVVAHRARSLVRLRMKGIRCRKSRLRWR